ncbi:uncharacterized protein LOC100215135 isoform X1 [Hydra vulgaris]|uniref:uncharacterized protein LOC100215135 isoform X1 n=2 Tax=Hydra vulgaris TaxID=6087 RepID=UPI001F5F8E6F|nr:uncharacterized protein LOC100215135 isoform X1 [Hydra vulgaris]
MDESLIDLKYIHWGYMHCCQTVSNKRNAKKHYWNTFWVELSGTVLRLYKDCTLLSDCAFYNVPRIDFTPLKENLITVAFLDLRCSSVKTLLNKKKSAYSDTYRRHLFLLRLLETNNQYVFQAHSLSSMLVWVAKIQESIDACKENISFLADEKMKFVKYLMDKRRAQINFPVKETTTCPADFIKEEMPPLPKQKNQKLAALKKSLLEMKELAIQFDQQMIDFFGNKGVFKRDEFVCQIKKDYYLISGRRDTLIPANTNVTVFGQLRNRRWRCFVERNDILNSLKNLLRDLKNKEENEVDDIMKKINNIPDYPLIGSLPNSVLNFVKSSAEKSIPSAIFFDNNNNCGELSACFDSDCREFSSAGLFNKCDGSNSFLENSNLGIVHSISTFSHDASVDSAISDCGSINEVVFSDKSNDWERLATNDMKRLTIYDPERLCNEDSETSSLIDQALTDSETSDYESNTENSSSAFLDVSDTHLRTGLSTGEFSSKSKDIIITKKLKRRGIRISVGSSSSDEEDNQIKESSQRTYITNAVFKDMFSEKQTSCNEDTEWNQSDKNYIRVRPRKELKHSYSYDQINGTRDVSIKLDILRRFSKKSIVFKQENSRMKQILDDVGTGADVKPPRNEWRTLKLSKLTDQEFGFSLQKYTFQKCDGTIENRLFVDNVKDEGSAYIGGLREGDVILKVNNEKVEDIDYNKILEFIQGDEVQLDLVVKYMDAVNHRDLTERLKEKEAALAARKLLLEKLEKEIEELYSLNLNECDSDKEDINRSSIYSNASDNGSITSDLSDDTQIKIRETEIFPSCDSLEQIEFLDINELTTETDLLDSYSEKIKNGPTVRRAESMPVQKNKSNLNFKFKTTNEEYRISDIIEEHNCVNQNVNCEETRNDNSNSIHISNRTKSYKKAIKYKTKI